MAVGKAYKANIIKAIFPDEYSNADGLSPEIIERYYKADNIYLNAFQVPDQLTNINSYHGFSKNITKVGESFVHYFPDSSITYTTPLIDASEIDVDEINSSYHKILMGKDIDWDNAYLRYSPLSFKEQEKPIIYWDIDPNTGQKKVIGVDPETGEDITEETTSSYMFYSDIPTYVNHTYDLYAIIDYLLLKIKALQFMLAKVKSQRENMETYNLHQSNS